jgi:hypothetical protein
MIKILLIYFIYEIENKFLQISYSIKFFLFFFFFEEKKKIS